jgi:dihydrofolate reductase
MATDTTPSEFTQAHQKRRFVQFDPTLNSGHLLQILVLVIGGIAVYATFTAERATQKLELEQVKKDAQAEKTVTKESLVELKTDVKMIQQTLNQVTTTLAIINDRQAPKEPKK